MLGAATAAVIAPFAAVTPGFIADRRPHVNVVLVIGTIFVGTVGLVMMSFRAPSLFLVGTFIVVIGLFGWNGLLVAASIRLLPGSPAKVLGWLQVGFFTGATMAPMVFGVLIRAVGVQGALVTAAVCASAGAIVIMSGEIIRRSDKTGQECIN